MRPFLSRNVMMGGGPGQKMRVENTNTPVCLLHGRHDPIARTGYMQSISGENIFAGRCIVFDESGHAPFLDAADKFDTLLAQFADSVETGEATADHRSGQSGYALAG